jgi:SpoVK/Ycf46/Vps4 family AAA+-type ATPase
MSEARVQYTQWLKRGTNTFIPTDNSVTQPLLDRGVYNIRYEERTGYYLVKKELTLDELVELPSPESQEVIESIELFWSKKEEFSKYGYAYKRGVLLYGKPGGGKTSIINLLCDKLINEKDGVVFTLSSEEDLHLYSKFIPEIYRVIEPNTPLIVIIEDIDGLCQSKDVETKLINVLDGIEQLDNIVYLATTNYPERLSERVASRPNRFDRRIEVKSPNTSCRKMYFEKKLKKEDLVKINIEDWVKKTEGLSMAELGEIIKSVLILENSFETTIEVLNSLKKIPNSRDFSAAFSGGVGFNKSN